MGVSQELQSTLAFEDQQEEELQEEEFSDADGPVEESGDDGKGAGTEEAEAPL